MNRPPSHAQDTSHAPAATAASGQRVGLGATPTVVTVAAALVGASLPVFLLSALAPAIQRDLGFGEAGLGLAVAAFFLAAAASSVPGGRFADRFGASVALRMGLAIAVVGGLVIAVFAGSRWTLVAAMFLAGSSLGFVDTGGARAIAAAVPTVRQGIAFGAKESSIPAASFLAGASVPLLGSQLGWRAAFGVGVGLAVVIGLLVSGRLELPSPSTAGTSGERPRGRAERASAVRASPRAVDPGPPSAGIWPLVLLAVTAALGGGAAAATTAFLVASSVAGGLSPGAAGTLLAAASAVALAARLLVGLAADRRAGAAVPIVATMLVLGSVGGTCLALGTASGGATTAFLMAGAFLAIGSGWGWTGLVFLAAVRLDASRPAKAAGIVLSGLGLGGAVGPASFGGIAGRAGYATAWWALAAAMLLAALAAALAHRLAQR